MDYRSFMPLFAISSGFHLLLNIANCIFLGMAISIVSRTRLRSYFKWLLPVFVGNVIITIANVLTNIGPWFLSLSGMATSDSTIMISLVMGFVSLAGSVIVVLFGTRGLWLTVRQLSYEAAIAQDAPQKKSSVEPDTWPPPPTDGQ